LHNYLQSLLPNRLSQLGPGVGWHDLDSDGNEDLIITSGNGGKLSIYMNKGVSGFSPIDSQNSIEANLDQTSVVAWSNGENRSSIITGISNYEDHYNTAPSALKYKYQDGVLNTDTYLPEQQSSTGEGFQK